MTLLGGGAAWGLDRYVIDHVEIAHTSSLVAPKAVPVAPATTGTRTATSYKSETATITVKNLQKGSGKDKFGYIVADVVLRHATILRSGFAHDEFGRNITANTSDIAAERKAVLAINGDYYGFRDDGIVIRNGVSYRDKGKRKGLAFYTDGSARLYDETATTAGRLIDEGVWNTLSFGPALVENGQIPAGIDKFEMNDFPFKPGGRGSIQGPQPRTGIGFIGTNHFVMIVVDGRGAGGSRGATMPEFAQLFREAGASTAYNLDGGGSTTMVFCDKVINHPAWFRGKQRGTSDILYVAG